MFVTEQERKTREIVQAIHEQVIPERLHQTADIREAALAEFTRELDAKLRNLHDGERLLLTYRLDIATVDNRIRAGSGGGRNTPEYAKWRNAVFARDNHTCRKCGARGALHAQHILHWATHPHRRFDLINGLTLCVPCHAAKHPQVRLIHG